MTDTDLALRERVRLERKQRGWSVRAAALEGGISNTTWGWYEHGRHPLTHGVIAGVAKAFDWSPNWTTVTPPDDLMQIAVLRRQVLELTEQMELLQRQVEVLAADLASRR